MQSKSSKDIPNSNFVILLIAINMLIKALNNQTHFHLNNTFVVTQNDKHKIVFIFSRHSSKKLNYINHVGWGGGVEVTYDPSKIAPNST